LTIVFGYGINFAELKTSFSWQTIQKEVMHYNKQTISRKE